MAHNNTTIELSTYYALYQFLKVDKNSKYTVSNRARKVSTVTINENGLHFDIVKGSIFDTHIAKNKYTTYVYGLIGKLALLDAQVKADLVFIASEERRVARESLTPGDLDKAFYNLEQSIEQYGEKADLRLYARIRNNTCIRYELSYHHNSRTITDLPALNNNSALIYLFVADGRCSSYDEDLCNSPQSTTWIIEELERTFGSYRELKLNALAAVLAE